MSLNKVMLIGNVGQDPDVRYLESQTKVASLRLATTEVYTTRNGERKENTTWHSIQCWRNLADLCEKYIRKGSQIYVEGRLTSREWTDQTGAKRISIEVEAQNIQLLGRRQDNPASQNAPQVYGQGGNSGMAAQPYQSAPAPQQPYQPYAPSYQNVTPAPAPAVQTPQPAAPMQDFGSQPTDDLPF